MRFDTGAYNRSGAHELMGRLGQGDVLLAQGAMGTALTVEGGSARVPPSYWNIAEPQAVSRLHRLYVDAGADVLISNTFQASSPTLARDEVYASVREVNDLAVRAARSAMPSSVLGSIGPAGLEWFEEDSPEYRAARSAYREQAWALLSAGADALLLETFTSIRDLIPALAGAGDVADGMPVLVSFSVDDRGDLLGDGLNIEAAIVFAEKHGAAAVGVNCCPVAGATDLVRRMRTAARTPVMVRPYASLPTTGEDGLPVWDEDPEAFAAALPSWVDAGVALVGSCCGSTVRTTCALRAALDELPSTRFVE